MKDVKSYLKESKLIKMALTHCSYVNEHPGVESNERLEYLGDAVIEFLISEELYKRFPGEPEGRLTAMRSKLVQTAGLAKVARKLKLGEMLMLSKGEERSGGRENNSLLENTFEAVVGAVYLEGGVREVREFLRDCLFPEIEELKNMSLKDPKSSFQEKVQARELPTPVYQVMSEAGPDHSKRFKVAVLVGKRKLATGEGSSKQRAETEAAREALKVFEGEWKKVGE
jgi:ribonuclease-3